jgi:hypothetical protein
VSSEVMGLALLAIVLVSTLSVLAELHGGQDDVR